MGLTVKVGGGGGVQVHVTVTGLSPSAPEKVKVPALQGRDEMVTCTDPFGNNFPLAGVKVTLLPKSLLAVQFALPCEMAVSPTVRLQEYVPLPELSAVQLL